jgi:hypothetical protein
MTYGVLQNIVTKSLELSSRAKRGICFWWLTEKLDSSRQKVLPASGAAGRVFCKTVKGRLTDFDFA